MRIRFLIVTFAIFFSLCSSVSGKDNRKEMRTIIDKGLNTAIVQSKQMAEKLLGQKDELPRTIGKRGAFIQHRKYGNERRYRQAFCIQRRKSYLLRRIPLYVVK